MLPFSFLYPYAFFGLLSIAAIYYLYKNKKTELSKVIPSLFLLKKIKLPVHSKSKKNIPLRFILESICIFLLILAIASPEYQSTNKRVAIVFDLSLSMSAKDSQNNSRLEKSKTKLTNYLNSQNSGVTYYLKLVPEFLNKELNLSNEFNKEYRKKELLDKLTSLKFVPFPDNLENFLQDNTEYFIDNSIEEVAIFSDKVVNGRINPNIKTTSFSIDSKDPNLYLISANTSIKTENTTELNISYGLSGIGSSKVVIRVDEISPEEQNLIEVEQNILGGSEVSDIISLGNILKNRNAVLKVSLSLSPLRDAISYDNYAYLIHRTNNESSSINFITPSIKEYINEKTSLEQALEKNVNHLSYESFKNDLYEAKATLNIFYKVPAPDKIRTNSLIIIPSTSNKLITSTKVKSPTITSWDNTNSITRYLNLKLLNIHNGLLIQNTDWANSVINTNNGSLVAAGMLDNKKVIVSGIELLPFEANKNPVSSILLLNMLGTFNEFSKLHNDSDNIIKNFDHIEPLTEQVFVREKITPPLENGIYRGLSNNSETKEVFDIHNFFLNESDTLNTNYIDLSENKIINESKKTSDLSWYFIIIAVVILLIDLLLIIFFKREI